MAKQYSVLVTEMKTSYRCDVEYKTSDATGWEPVAINLEGSRLEDIMQIAFDKIKNHQNKR